MAENDIELSGLVDTPQPLNNMIEARQSDYDWPEIYGQVADFQNRAAQYGHSQEDADKYLGYDTSTLHSRLGGAIMSAVQQEGVHPIEAATDGWVSPTNNPDKPYNIKDTPDTARYDYAKALLNGEAKGPQDFADAFLDHAGRATDTDLSSLKWGIAANLPSPMQAVDYANGVAQQTGVYKSADIALTNLIDSWGATGQPIAQTYQASANDPFLREALTTPQKDVSERPDPYTVIQDPKMKRLMDLVNTFNLPYQVAKGFVNAVHGPEFEEAPILTPERIGEVLGRVAKNTVLSIPDQISEGERILAGGGGPPEMMDALTNAFFLSAGTMSGGILHGSAPPSPELVSKAMEFGKPGSITEPGVLDTFKQVLADNEGSILKGVRAPRAVDFGEGAATPSELDMRLRRFTGSVNAGSLSVENLMRAIPDEYREPSFDKALRDAVETRLYQPGTQMARAGDKPLLSPEQLDALDAAKKMTDMQLELARQVASKTDKPVDSLLSVDDGYVHRVWDQKELAALDPNVSMDLTSGYRPPNKLSKFVSSMEARSSDMYVFDHNDGTRVWGNDALENLGTNPATQKPYKIGDTIETPNGKTVTISRPTSKEIETNMPNYKAVGGFFQNTIMNLDRLQKVNKALDFLADNAKDLADRGQFIAKDEAKGVIPNGVRPAGYMDIDIPGLKGWIDPRLGKPLNDFWKPGTDDTLNMLNRLNGWLVNPMFLNPAPHIENMGNGYLINRASDWINPFGYSRQIQALNQAMREIAARGPVYQEHMAAGSGLPFASQAAQNFRAFLAQKTLADMKADPETWGAYANGIGVGLGDLYRGMEKGIHSGMWWIGDVMKFSRELEYRAKGYDLDTAIRLTEKDMASYQIPSEIAGQRWLSQVMKTPIISAFGRFHYALANSVAQFVKDVAINPLMGKGTKAEFVDAVAKATIAGAIAYYNVPFLYNHGVSKLVDDAQDLWKGQKHYSDIINAIAMTSTVVNALNVLRGGRDYFGNQIIKDKAPLAQKFAEAGKELSNFNYPMQLAVHGMDKGWDKAMEEAVGLKVKQAYTPSAAKDWQAQKDVYYEYQRPGFIHDMTNWLGGTSPDTPVNPYKHPGSGGPRGTQARHK